MKREHWTFHERKRPEPRVVGTVLRKDKEFVWLKVGGEEKRVATKEAEKVSVGARVLFTTTGMYGVAKRPGVFVESGTIEVLPRSETTSSSTPVDAEAAIFAKEDEGERPPVEPSAAVRAFMEREFGSGEASTVETKDEEPVRADTEVEVEIDSAEGEAPRRSDEEREKAGPPKHTLCMDFEGETPIFYVRIREKRGMVDLRIPLRGVKTYYLLPGDIISINKRNAYTAEVVDVEYTVSPYVSGFVERSEETGRLHFAVRCPDGSGVLRKYSMAANFPEAEEALADKRIILLDRKSGKVIDRPEFHTHSSSYEMLKRGVLTNMGVYEYSDRGEISRQEEQYELAQLLRDHGIDEEGDPKTLDARLEPALTRKADEEVKRGEVRDLRGTNSGKRQTFYIDPYGSKDHDDALSIEDKQDERGEGWYEIGIHIADVARYVKTGSAIELQAAFRGSSIYLDDETIRMLPSLLSEHLASLNAGQTRFAFSLMFDVKMEPTFTKEEKLVLEKMTDEERAAFYKEHDERRRPWRDRKVRIENIRFEKTVIQVTEGLTYSDAQRRIDDNRRDDDGTRALRDLMEFARRLRARKGVRTIGNDYNPKEMDTDEMVAEFMLIKNRAAGAAYERFKNASMDAGTFVTADGIQITTVAQPHLRSVQDLVLGVYRTQEILHNEKEQEYIQARVEGQKGGRALPASRTWREWAKEKKETKGKKSAPTHIEVLLALGVLEESDLSQRNGKPVPFVKLARLARARVASGGYTVPKKEGEPGTMRVVTFSKNTIEGYFSDARRLPRSGARYSIQEGGHASMGIENYTRLTSPIRREADSRAQRKLQFELKLMALVAALRKEGKDIDEQKVRELAIEYAEQVVGAEIPREQREDTGPLEKFLENIALLIDARDKEALKHDLERETLAQRAEGVVGSLHTAVNIYGHLYGDEVPEPETRRRIREKRGLPPPPREFVREWVRGERTDPKRPFTLEGMYETRDGYMEPQGLIFTFTRREVRVDREGYVYGEIRISNKTNQVLRRFLPPRIQEQGARLQVKFKLPPGFEHPVEWCERNNIDDYRVKIPGKIVGVGVEQGRIEFRIKKGIRQDEAYIDMRPDAIEKRKAAWVAARPKGREDSGK